MRSEGRSPLIFTALEGISMIQEGDHLDEIILLALEENQTKMIDGDVLVIAQKIVSKVEGQRIDLNTVVPSEEAQDLAEKTGKDSRLVELILKESREVLRSRPGLIIVEHRLGFVCANAGIDRSNVAGKDSDFVLLLPANPDKSAQEIRQKLEIAADVQIGVVINDSHGRAWRNGTVGTSIGFSGIPGIVDLRGELDLFDYQLRVTEIAAVDELAAGASLLMGQAAEGIPVVHVRGFPYLLREGSFEELPRAHSKDMFR
ncbi:MAG: coenzyme F420-0:L-glutamate ligase [Anaerolineales bacterium]|nr:coenzyme F420-0:L-glutamate ligase [Anaerolineales bacterium]